MKTGFLLACVLCTFASCYLLIDPIVQSNQFPLAAGNTWSYTHQFSITNFKPTVPGATFQDVKLSYPASVTILGVCPSNIFKSV